jgi:hypothetical protein
MPSILFGEHSKTMLFALIQEKEEAIARVMNNFYKDYAKYANYKLETEHVVTKSDFSIVFGRLDTKGTMMLLINMPDDTSDGIVCLKHIILFNSKEMKPRLFTVEKSPSSALDFFSKLPEENKKTTLKNFLCEVKSGGKHLNCGYAPENDKELYKKLYELY